MGYNNDYSNNYGNYDNNGNNPKKGRVPVIVGIIVIIAVVAAGAWGLGTLGTGGQSSLQAETGSSVSSQSATQSTASDSGTVETAASVVAGSTDITGVVSQSMPGVVSIANMVVYDNYSQYGYSPFGSYYGGSSGSSGSSSGESEEVKSGSGSGVIIGKSDTELWIVTNNHVVEGASSLVVTFSDDTTAQAQIKGASSDQDVAVIAVQLSDMSDDTKNTVTVIPMGDSDQLELGQYVIVIGNALGMGQSVTDGIISATSREVTFSDGTTKTLLQTNAAINSGNSGGAMLDINGNLIGISTAKYSSVSVEGICYGIPISQVKDLIEEYTQQETKSTVSESDYPYLGVSLQDIDSSVATVYNMPEGIYVYSVEEDSPASEAGIQAQDIITAFDGQAVTSTSDLEEILQYYSGGTTVDITVQRAQNGSYQEQTISITLGRKSDYTTQSQTTQAAQ